MARGHVRRGREPRHPPLLPHQARVRAVVREECARPWRVYRPGIVVGDSRTGEIDKVDGPYYFFKLLQRARRVLPAWLPTVGVEGGEINIVPVDYVAAAIDHIAHQPGLDGQAFYLTDPNPKTAGEVVNLFAKAADAPQAAMRLDAEVTDPATSLVRIGAEAVPAGEAGLGNRRWTSSASRRASSPTSTTRPISTRPTPQAALDGSGIEVPPLESYADRLWDYWERNLDPDLFKDRSLSRAVRGKVVLITGASSGIGKATAVKVADAGATVLLVARSMEKLEETKEEIEAAGGVAHIHRCDMSDIEDVERMAEEVLAYHGQVDILVNNAGRSIRRSVALSYDRFHDYERTMQLNYFGAVRLILALLPGDAGAQVGPNHQHQLDRDPDQPAAVLRLRRLEGCARRVRPGDRLRGGRRRRPHHDDPHAAGADADDRPDPDVRHVPGDHPRGGGGNDRRARSSTSRRRWRPGSAPSAS